MNLANLHFRATLGMRSTEDPLQNMLSFGSAARGFSDTFYSGTQTDAFWGRVNDAQAAMPGSGRGLDAYRINNPFNPFGATGTNVGGAQGIYPTEATREAQSVTGNTQSDNRNASQPNQATHRKATPVNALALIGLAAAGLVIAAITK